MSREDGADVVDKRGPASAAVARLLEAVAPSSIGDDRFTIDISDHVQGHLFGGLLAAQALFVAYATVEPGRLAQSAHAYFLRRGNPGVPLHFEVQRDTDGRSFSARRVTASQEGQPIFTMACSFHVPEDTTEILQPFPDATSPPTSLPVETFEAIDDAFEIRCVLPDTSRPNDEGSRIPGQLWVRAAGELPDDPVLHDALLFYASDIGTPWNVRALSHLTVTASLDHAIWMHHRPIRIDEWHAIDLKPGALTDAWGFYTGGIWHRDGTHVASVAQENLLRPR